MGARWKLLMEKLYLNNNELMIAYDANCVLQKAQYSDGETAMGEKKLQVGVDDNTGKSPRQLSQRCRTSSSLLGFRQGYQVVHRSSASLYEDDEDRQHAGYPPYRSRSSSRESLCSAVSMPTIRNRSDTNQSWTTPACRPRFRSFTGVSKPYCISYSIMDVGKDRQPNKTLNVIHNNVFGGSKNQVSKLSNKIVRKLSSKETSTSNNSAAVRADQTVTMRRAVMKRHPTVTVDHQHGFDRFSGINKSTSEENIGPSTSTDPSGLNNVCHYAIKRKSSADLLEIDSGCDSAMPAKVEKRRADSLKHNLKGMFEIFTAVEQDDIGKVRRLLERKEVNINEVNQDELTLLDVAIMLNHKEVALLLLKHGAIENAKLMTPAVRAKHLQHLIDQAAKKLAEIMLIAKQPVANSKDADQHICTIESRIHMLKKMKNNFDSACCPGAPKNVFLHVSGCNSLVVQFEPPDQTTSIVTRYKVEWAVKDFSNILGCLMIRNLKRLEVQISNLESGVSYCVRVTSCNLKGCGDSAVSHPEFATPSSWKEVDSRPSRTAGKLSNLNNLYHEVKEAQRVDNWGKKFPLTTDSPQKRKKTSLKSLFLATSKFQKNLKRGAYLCTVAYKDDRILLTVDDFLPIVQVDENCPISLPADFNWLVKVSCAWEDSKSLIIDSDTFTLSPALQFRTKLLEAASSMQAALGISDLGRLHHQPITDSNGVTIFVTFQRIPDLKNVQGLAVKWVQMNKFLRKQLPIPDGEPTAVNLLISGLLDYLNFHESACVPLDKGLYLGYVKLHSTMNQINIVVPENLPSVLPFVYIRDNSHVSRDEWEWLRVLDSNRASEVRPTAAQLSFHWSLASAARILMDDLEVDDKDSTSHRIYRLEVVEFHPEVSFILLVPSHLDVCTAPGQQIVLGPEKRGCLSLPVSIFELSHLCTYQPDFISLYCRLSCLLDVTLLAAQQLFRQAFSEEEVKSGRSFVDKLLTFQSRLDEIWKSVRWVTDVATAARDKQIRCGLPLGVLFAYATSDFVTPTLREQPSQEDMPTTSDSPATAQMPIAPERNSRESDEVEVVEVEDNSDVGYHSDQSIERSGLIPAAIPNGSEESSTSDTSAINSDTASGSALVNPTYDFLPPATTSEDLKRNSIATGSVTQHLTLRDREYVNLPLSIDKRDDSLYGTLVGPSFLHSHSKRYRWPIATNNHQADTYRTQILCDKEANPSAIESSGDEKPPVVYCSTASVSSSLTSESSSMSLVCSKAETTPSRPKGKNHDYVNYISDTSDFESHYAKRRNQQNPEVRAAAIKHTGRISDSELNHNSTTNCRETLKRRADPPALSEDLSVIDRVYEMGKQSHMYPTDVATPFQPIKVATSEGYLAGLAATNSPRSASSHQLSTNSSLTSPLAYSRPPSTTTTHSSQDSPSPGNSGILRIYAAYDTGLAKGTSVKLHVTPKTTSKEVVTLVVQQLNKAIQLKGLSKPFYADEDIKQFCLVAVIGSRERCLRDDFKPLDLQNPWCKGRLFVRRRHDVLAALEYGNGATV